MSRLKENIRLELSSQVNLNSICIRHQNWNSEVAILIAEIALQIQSVIKFPAGFRWDLDEISNEFKQSICYVAEVDCQLKAFIFFRILGDVAEITCIGTSLDAQRCGLSSRIFELLKKDYPQITEWWLEVHENNLGAILLYRKWGFETVGFRKCYYRDGAGAHLMKLKLASL